MRSLSSIRLPIFLKIATGLSVAILLGATLALMVQSRISIAPLRQHLQQMAADLAEEMADALAQDVWNLDRQPLDTYFTSDVWSHLGLAAVQIRTEFDDLLYEKRWRQETHPISHRHPVFHDGQIIGSVEVFLCADRLRSLRRALQRSGLLTLALAFAATWGAGLLLARWIIVRPLQRIQSGLRSIAGGDYGHQLPGDPSAELDNMIGEINALSTEIRTRRDQLEREIAIRRQAEETVTALNRDLDQRVRVRTLQLVESEQRFRMMFENATDAILVAEIETRRLIDANPAASRLFGYGREELLTLTVGDLHQPESAAQANAIFDRQAQQTADALAVDQPGRRKDGSLIYFDINAFPLRMNGRTFLAGICRDMTARKQAEELRQEHQRQIRRLAAQLATAQDAEQRRIAEGLHDEVAQLIAAAHLKLSLAARSTDPAAVRRILDETDRLLGEANAQVRSLSFELASSTLGRLGLNTALEELCEGMNRRHNVHFTVRGDPDPPALPDTLATVLFKSARELLFNVVKHAGTQTARVSVSSRAGEIQLTVEDPGQGFTLLPDEQSPHTGQGLGLFGIRERLRDIGGSLRIESEPGRLTRVILTVPYP